MTDWIEAAAAELSELMSGAAIRSVAGIKELGEVLVATIGDGSPDVNLPHQKGNDVWTRFTDTLSGMTDIGRLFVPAGILWRAPASGDGAHVARGRKQRGPGAALVMPDGGDGATGGLVPPWFPDDAGLYDVLKNLRIHSKNGTVTLDAAASVIIAALNLNIQHLVASQAGGAPPVSTDLAHLTIADGSNDFGGYFTIKTVASSADVDIDVMLARPFDNESHFSCWPADGPTAALETAVTANDPTQGNYKVFIDSTKGDKTKFHVSSVHATGSTKTPNGTYAYMGWGR